MRNRESRPGNNLPQGGAQKIIGGGAKEVGVYGCVSVKIKTGWLFASLFLSGLSLVSKKSAQESADYAQKNISSVVSVL
jgi:hypothetical protein